MPRKTRTQALYDWFHGRTDKPMPTPETDVGEGCYFTAGWDALASDPLIAWCIEQHDCGRHLVALTSPSEAHDGPRYAGYYCIDAPLDSAKSRNV
jgi:hypothetical protein